MSPAVTQRDLADLGDELFEQLVASLVLREHPDAERPDAPDGGADVLLTARDREDAVVWQVKHYPERPAWKKCEASLDTAVATYRPGRVIFVFPRDLTKAMRQQFERRLQGRHKGVEVTAWTLFHLQEKLAEHDDIRARYFDKDKAEVLPALMRAVRQGVRPLESTTDVADRAFGLDEFTDVTDPNFEYAVSFGGASLPSQTWERTPYLIVTERRGDRQVSVPAWPREGVEVPPTTFGFNDDENGRTARERVREGLAAGEQVELREGIWFQIPKAPRYAMEALKNADLSTGRYQLQTGEMHQLTMTVEVADERLERHFDIRAIPPREGSEVAFGCVADGLALFLDFTALQPPEVNMQLRLSPRVGPDMATNARAAEFMVAFVESDQVTCRCEELLPADLEVIEKGPPDAHELGYISLHAHLFRSLAVIEEHLGRRLKVPDTVKVREVQELVDAAAVLRDRGGRGRFGKLTQELPAAEVKTFLDQIERGGVVRHPVTVPLLGEQVVLGMGEFELPHFKLVVPRVSDRLGHAQVDLVPDDEAVRFRLIDPETDPHGWEVAIWIKGHGAAGSPFLVIPG